MPFRTGGGGGFTGDGNAGDFIDQVVETFLTDAKAAGGLGWTSHAHDGSPLRSKGSSPDFEFFFSREGSPAQVPIWCMQTNSKTLHIYTGNSIDTTQESFDQPGNPINEPVGSDPPSDITSGSVYQQKSMGVTTIVGPYDDYWVFGGETAEYCHVVLKVGTREYRHFHVGLLDRFDDTIDPDTFYITSHCWAYLDPDDLTIGGDTNTDNKEHQPYQGHRVPFGNCSEQNLSNGNDARARGMMVYCPNFGTEGYDWWAMVGLTNSGGGAGGGSDPIYGEWRQYQQPGNVGNSFAITKAIGDVNTNLESPLEQVQFGCGSVLGYDDALGAIPFSCEPTFTTDGIALIPIVVCLFSDFDSEFRWAPIGQVPDVFRVNMKTLDAEQEISIGSDTYVVFPLINKDANNTLDGEGYSGYEGLAYRKITANAT